MLPKIHIIATGGTIAGKSSEKGYVAGKTSIEEILSAVPELKEIARLDFEQFCNIGSQDMDETIWLALSKRVDSLLLSEEYDGVVITHGTDTMEETACFLNWTIHSAKPVVLVGSMRPSDALDADGPANLLVAVRGAADVKNAGKEVLLCLGKKLLESSEAFKKDSHEIDALGCVPPDFRAPHGKNFGFDIRNENVLPRVGIVYGYGGASTIPLQAFMDAGYDGVVLAGVGGGNFYSPVQRLAEKAVRMGMLIVRSTRCPYGGVYTLGGEVDDLKLGFVAAGSLNPQKARVLLMLALTETRDVEKIRLKFQGVN
ncbi:MAG: type II asparaginase [Fibrobacter sp.]|nr:type II asparaginase [Fibrobacter sp.]